MFLTTWADSIIDVGDNANAREMAQGFTKTLGFVVRDGASRRYISVAVTPEQLEALRSKLETEAE